MSNRKGSEFRQPLRRPVLAKEAFRSHGPRPERSRNRGRDTHTVDATGSFEGNSANAVCMAALADVGLARLSTHLVADKIASGELIRLFPDYVQNDSDVAVIFADKRNLAPKIRVLVDFLADHFQRL